MVFYDVCCAFDDEGVAQRWVQWLHQGHLDDVKRAGAVQAEVVRVRSQEICYEARYRFESSEDFEAYERDHAPALRAEGLERFPLALGLRYTRRVSDTV